MIGGISAQYMLQPIAQPIWTTESGATYTNVASILNTTSYEPLWQHAIFPTTSSKMYYEIPNTNASSGDVRLYFRAYDTISESLNVVITTSGSQIASQTFSLTNTPNYYNLVFTASASDAFYTINLSGPGMTDVYISDWSIVVGLGSVGTSLEGNLTLLQGEFTTPSVTWSYWHRRRVWWCWFDRFYGPYWRNRSYRTQLYRSYRRPWIYRSDWLCAHWSHWTIGRRSDRWVS